MLLAVRRRFTSSSSSSARYYETGGANPIRDLYRTEIEVFSQPGVGRASTSICMLLVGLHLRHGISSGFQSLGLDHPLYTRRLVTWGIVGAIVIGGGLVVIPLLVYLTP